MSGSSLTSSTSKQKLEENNLLSRITQFDKSQLTKTKQKKGRKTIRRDNENESPLRNIR